MSDVTGGHARLGRRRRGRTASRCWTGSPPEHRDGCARRWLGAATYGAFDVSFRVPDRRRPLGLDRRPRPGASAEPGEAAIGRIIGVALDVTEERLAQARAQAAETRLRDAIESVSEAFVLWDRRAGC